MVRTEQVQRGYFDCFINQSAECKEGVSTKNVGELDKINSMHDGFALLLIERREGQTLDRGGAAGAGRRGQAQQARLKTDCRAENEARPGGNY